MDSHAHSLQRRVESVKIRIEALSALRKLVDLPPYSDITQRQWFVLESQLSNVELRLLSQLKAGARKYLPRIHDPHTKRSLNALLGKIELTMAKAFAFFDTYMDVLTQRHTSELGKLLAGCDVLAWDCINKDHPALAIIEPPLVYCDRGFGASTLREGVLFPTRISNPMPLIQIPYSRLKEKHNLASVLHEAGHEVMVRLGMISIIPEVFRSAMKQAGAPGTIGNLFALWSSEIGPDFWAFCASGVAQTGGIKEILALPSDYVFRVSQTDPHPPPYLRALLSFEWCRQTWGKGEWDKWEQQWLELYPLRDASKGKRRTLEKARSYLPVISRALLNTRFRILNRRTIPDLFDLPALAPSELKRTAMNADSGTLAPKGFSPCMQLSVFRLVREQGRLEEEALDKIMTRWLISLGQRRHLPGD